MRFSSSSYFLRAVSATVILSDSSSFNIVTFSPGPVLPPPTNHEQRNNRNRGHVSVRSFCTYNSDLLFFKDIVFGRNRYPSQHY